MKTLPKSPAKAKLSRAFPTLALEILLIESSGGPVCGVDEAGRGPWAGPVSAGAVILNPADLPAGIDDSKALTHARREALEIEIKARAIAWGVGFASVDPLKGAIYLGRIVSDEGPGTPSMEKIKPAR